MKITPSASSLGAARRYALILVSCLAASACSKGGASCGDEPSGGASSGGASSGFKPSCKLIAPVRVGEDNDWRLIAADHLYTCAIRRDNSLWCWGANEAGKLGDGTSTDRYSPVRVGTWSDWKGVTGADFLTCAWRESGEDYCWGGQRLGAVIYPPEVVNGTPEPLAVRARGPNPGTLEETPLDLAEITIGDGHTCGLTTAGAIYCWAGPHDDRLGVTNPPVTPAGGDRPHGVAVAIDLSAFSPPPVFTSVSAGSRHTCGLSKEGRIYCWGGNSWGQVGIGSTDELVPTPHLLDTSAIGPDVRFASVATGTFHTCAITTEGKAYCWGSGVCGSLGDGHTSNQRSPVPVDTSNMGAASTFTKIDGGLGTTCGIATDGSLFCWGTQCTGDAKESKDAEELPCSRPQPLPTPPGAAEWRFEDLALGADHACAITVDSALYCWGGNEHGQCGVGETSFDTTSLKR